MGKRKVEVELGGEGDFCEIRFGPKWRCMLSVLKSKGKEGCADDWRNCYFQNHRIEKEWVKFSRKISNKFMSTKSVIENILLKSVDKLGRSNLPPPNKESLKLYRQILKFTRKIDWTDQDGRPW